MRRRTKLALGGNDTRPAPKQDPREVFKGMFGKYPHHKMKPETILKRIENGKSGNGGS